MNRKAFTLIELLVVVAIIGILFRIKNKSLKKFINLSLKLEIFEINQNTTSY